MSARCAERLAAIVLAGLMAGLAVLPCAGSQALAQANASAADEYFTADELQQLVGPIAIYPDALIAIVLPASTAPRDVVQAAQFLGVRARDPSAQPPASWPEPVRALLNYPDVVTEMAGNLDWTNELGLAVANQQADVLDAIQRFRRRALRAGNLRSDANLRMRQSGASIVIELANPEEVHLPQYDPDVVVEVQPAPLSMFYYPYPYYNYWYPYPPDYAYRRFANPVLAAAAIRRWDIDWANGGINRNVNVDRAGAAIGSGERWQGQRLSAGNTQLAPALRGGGTGAGWRAGVDVGAGAGAGGIDRGGLRDPGRLGPAQRPGDPGFGDGIVSRPRPQPGLQPGGQPLQQRLDAFSPQGSYQTMQRDAMRGQASRSYAAPRGGFSGGGMRGGGMRGGGGPR